MEEARLSIGQLQPASLDDEIAKADLHEKEFSEMLIYISVAIVLLGICACLLNSLLLYRKEGAAARKRMQKAKKIDKDVEV